MGKIIQPPLLLYNFVDLSGIFSAVWNQHIYLRISRLWYQRGGFDDDPVKSIHMVMTDEKGNHANETVPNEVIDMFVDTLNERNLYKRARIYVRQWKAPIQDIDKVDGDNQLAFMDYVNDLYKFYKVAEVIFPVPLQNERRPRDYIHSQVHLNSKMRAILVDWIIEVHDMFDLMPETLYLIVYIIDRYLTKQLVLRRELQLVRDLVWITDNAYSRRQILRMEKAILNRLGWNLTVPTPYVFLARFAMAASSYNLNNYKEMMNMVSLFAELALMQYALVPSKPSMVAAAAVYAVRLTLKKTDPWTHTLKHYTGFTESQLIYSAKMLVTAHSTAPQSKLQVVYKKYCSKKLGRVALRPPAINFK
uniref:Cyclin-B1-1 n=1 Tax=Aegilops tauschii TaxID=37682 RepID=R7W5N7_AEGTA